MTASDILKEPRFNVATWNITTRDMAGTSPDKVTIDGKPLGFYHFTGFDSGAHGLMAEKNAASNVTLHQLIDWYRRSIAVAKTDGLAQLPWIFGTYANGEPIPAAHRRIYGMRRDLQEAFPDPFQTQPLANGHGGTSFIDWIKNRGVLEHADLIGDKAIQDAALLAEHKRPRAELKALKRSLSWRVTKPLRMIR